MYDHKFLVSGHSFLSNDRDFGSIEMRIRKANHLYIPEHYYGLIELCRKKNPFLVERMRQKDFIYNKIARKLSNKKSKKYTKIAPLYTTIGAITEEKYKDIKDLLPYILSIYQKYFKSLKTQNPIYEG